MLKLIRYTTILATLLLLSTYSFSNNNGYKIEVKINGFSNDTLFLGNHYGKQKFVIDTITVDSKGYGVFKGDKKLPGGIYLVILPSMSYFEILVADDQHFSIETNIEDYISNMVINGSKENLLFNNYQRFMTKNRNESIDLKKREQENANNPDSLEIIQNLLTENNNRIKQSWTQIVKDNPNTLFSKIILSLIDIEIPEPPKNNTDSLYQYKYYKSHYFDNIDFSEPRLLRTPIIQTKVEQFLNNLVVQVPDSVYNEAKILLKKAKVNDEVYNYMATYFLNYYENSHRMSMDRLFVNIAENYFLNDKEFWNDSIFIDDIQTRVNQMKPTLLGNVAPDLKMETHNGEYATLHQLKAKYTVIIFWEPECGHCKVEIPKLKKLYDKYQDKGLEVFAVYTMSEKEIWQRYIEANGLNWTNVYDRFNLTGFRYKYNLQITPTILLLNEKKEVIAKRISIDRIERILSSKL